MAGNAAEAGVTVTSRVLAVLGSFDEAHAPQALTEVAQRAHLAVPTAHRLVGELREWGALVRRADGRYVIGRRIWDLGLLAREQAGLRALASPFLNDLYAATLATVHLAVRDDVNALYLDRISGQASVPVVSQIGTRLPLHATGVGKVLLAHAPPDVLDRVLRSLTRVTPYTITAPGPLREQLRRVVREGYAWTAEEMSLGACSVAAPVLGPDGAVIAALGIVVPTLKRDRRRLAAALSVAAQGIGRSVVRAAQA